jgi:His/Glu/Gln/Arg/opine family amino acid ABC transporter permease subunit
MDFDYHVLVRYYPLLFRGLWMTVLITLVAVIGGVMIGLLICSGRLSRPWALRGVTRAYIGFFRTTPEMVLIFWVYFCLPPLLNIRLSAFWSGTLALTLVSGAYLAEIFRAGIQSMPIGQFHAAQALGLRPYQQWALVILPQAIRRMIPAFMAYLTELLKNTALLSAIGVAELAYQASTLGANTFRYMEFLSAVAVIFFAIIYPISVIARYFENRLRARVT